jgi:hypothetical protein
MKRYIIPSITIDPIFAMNILAGSLQNHNEYSDADDLSNRNLFDKMDDTYPSKGDGLWDEADD